MEIGTASATASLVKLGESNPIRIRLANMNQTWMIRPTVIKDLSEDLNLGSGFLERCGQKETTILKFSKGKTVLKVGTEKTELIQDLSERGRTREKGPRDAGKRKGSVPERLPKLTAQVRTKCKANTVTFVRTEVSGKQKSGTDIYVHPREGRHVETVGAIYRAKPITKVAVVNNSPWDYVIERGQTVARYEKYSPVDLKEEKVQRVAPKKVTDKELQEHKEQIIRDLRLHENDMLKQNPTIKEKVIKLVHQYSQVFGEPGLSTGLTKLTTFDIELKAGAKPHRSKVRPLNPRQMESLKEQMKLWLSEGIVEPSDSPFAHALVPAKKAGGAIRWAVDYRPLNEMTEADSFPLPNIAQNLEKLRGSKVFSALDAAAAYHTVPVSERTKPLLAFITPMGLYQFVRMPFGPKNSSACYARFIEQLLAQLKSESVVAYLDDILIFTGDLEKHVEELEKVLIMHQEAGIKLRPRKTHLFAEKTDYLGFSVSEKGVEMKEDYVERILSWPEPTTVKELNTWLGFVSYYRSFIKEFSELTAEMNTLRKEKVLKWTEEMSEKFRLLKEKFRERPIRSYPRYELPELFHVTTDWSNMALGGVLSQVQEGQERMIATAARKCSVHERNYGSVKGELAAVIFCFRKWEHILRYRKFVLVTDSQALRYLRTLKTPTGLWYRWLEEIQSYDFEVIHKPGKDNTNADALSRSGHHPEPSPEEIAEQEKEYVQLVRAVQELDRRDRLQRIREVDRDPKMQQMHDLGRNLSRENLVKVQKEDPIIAEVRQWVTSGQKPSKQDLRLKDEDYKVFRQHFDALKIQDDILYYPLKLNSLAGNEAWRIVLPREQGGLAFKWAHSHLSAGHFGVSATLKRAQKKFFYVGMTSDLQRRVEGCPTCIAKRTKINTKTGKHVPVATGYPGSEVWIDLVGPLPKSHDDMKYILTVEDSFTRHGWAFPVRNKYAATITNILMERYFAIFGIPVAIKSDNGTEFVNEMLKDLADRLQLSKKTTPVYNPHSNGVERMHRTLNQLMRLHLDREDIGWTRVLPAAMMAYNSKVHSSTNVTPFFAMYGREMRLPIDIVIPPPEKQGMTSHVDSMLNRFQQIYKYMRAHMQAQIRRNASGYMGKIREYKVGDKVWYLCPRQVPGKPTKLTDVWLGPYKIVKKISDVVYKITPAIYQGPSVTVHEQRLVPCTDAGGKNRVPSNLRIEDDGDELGEMIRPPGRAEWESDNIPIQVRTAQAEMLDYGGGGGGVVWSGTSGDNSGAAAGAETAGAGTADPDPAANTDTTQQNLEPADEVMPDLGPGPQTPPPAEPPAADPVEERVEEPVARHDVDDIVEPPPAVQDTVDPVQPEERPAAEDQLPALVRRRASLDRQARPAFLDKQKKRPREESTQQKKGEPDGKKMIRERVKRKMQDTVRGFKEALGTESSSDEENEKKLRQAAQSIQALRVLLQTGCDQPKRTTAGAAAYDVWAHKAMRIPPGKTVRIPLNLKCAIPPGYFCLLLSRSGLAARGVLVVGGVIDSDYRGSVDALLYNTTETVFNVQKGQRIAQAVYLPVVDVVFEQQDALPATLRHTDGFGSTGDTVIPTAV